MLFIAYEGDSQLADGGVARSEVDEGVGSSQVSCRLEDNMQAGRLAGRQAGYVAGHLKLAGKGRESRQKVEAWHEAFG